MRRVWRSCSWCDELNLLTGDPVYCGVCGHRGDVPRVQCDCSQCELWRRRTRVPSASVATDRAVHLVDYLHDAHIIDANGVSACGRPVADFDVCTMHKPWSTCRGCAIVFEAAKYLSSATPPPADSSPELAW